MQLQSAGAPPGRSHYIDNTRNARGVALGEVLERRAVAERSDGARRNSEGKGGTSVENTYRERERSEKEREGGRGKQKRVGGYWCRVAKRAVRGSEGKVARRIRFRVPVALMTAILPSFRSLFPYQCALALFPLQSMYIPPLLPLSATVASPPSPHQRTTRTSRMTRVTS